MKHIVKKRFGKKHIISLTLVGILAFLLVISIILTNALDNDGGANNPKDPPEIIEGEAIKNGMALAYPEIENKNKIDFINVKNPENKESTEFGFYYDKDEATHILYYLDSDGEPVSYFPEIYYHDTSFDYSTIFATATLSGVNVTLVDYLCHALQTPYFEERIPFETNAEKQDRLLAEFGLSDGEYTSVTFAYLDADGKEVERTIKIGQKSVTGTGYYFTVTDNGVERPYIYSSLSNYFEYALSNMTAFIKPMLIAPGLSSDKGQEPFYTTGYYQWLNQLHDGSCELDKVCAREGKCGTSSCTCEGGCSATTLISDDESRVIANVDTVSSSITSGEAKYESTDDKSLEINLRDYAEMLDKYEESGVISSSYEKASYERIIKALVGKSIGDGGFTVTLASPKSIIDFSDKSSVKYEYVITAVEAIITDSADITAPGTAVADNNLIKVTYTAKLDGKPLFKGESLHAVVDLSNKGFDTNAVAALRAAKIGESLNVAFSVDYTKENAAKKSSKYVITEIIDIYNEKDERISAVNETAKVGYRYEIWIDGVCIGTATYWLDLAKVEKGSEDAKVKNALLNKKVGAVNLEFDEHNAYYEYFLSFTSYSIKEINYFITGELISAFRFQNTSERDPYYGESIYENLMEDEHKLYGLNSGVCETLVKILGGASEDSNTGTGAGYAGDEVVAIGLTPEVMKEYGLYAYTVYFELPRGVLTKPSPEGEAADPNTPEDLVFSERLGFTLYISEPDFETNTRYIASDLYGVVTRVSVEDFVFLDYDFETFWARRNLIMVDVSHIDYLGVEFHMSDYEGNYKFDVIQNSNDNRINISVSALGSNHTLNKFIQFINDPDYAKYVDFEGGASLNDLYRFESGVESTDANYLKTLGENSFREVMHMIYYVTYVNLLEDGERTEPPSEDDLVMKMTLKLDPEVAKNASPHLYVYKFYRIDDRRVRVSLHREDSDGDMPVPAVSDFYISSFAFKKIATGFVSLLNAETIEMNDGYPD